MAYISFQPSDNFSTKLYNGNNSTQSITGVGFQPDLTWLKSYDTAGTWHYLTDSVRGVGKQLYSNSDSSQGSNPAVITAFDSDGFSLGDAADTNGSGVDCVAWSWKAGTTTGIAGSPSITPSSYSFNQTSGFSIVRYTANNTAGATLPHGLGVAPDMALFKCDSYAENWNMYNKNLTGGTAATYTIRLNNTAAEATTDNYNDTAQTSTTLFTVGNAGEINEGTRTYVAYFFKGIKGFSKMGSYIGTGSGGGDGPFIYTGFRPAFTICKIYDGNTNNWKMVDDKRPGYNLNNKTLNADSTAVESTEDNCDYTANGFKIRRSGNDVNGSGYKYIYMAFAEFPFVSSNSKAGVAR